MPETCIGKNMLLDGMTRMPDSSVKFVAQISGAGFWLTCDEHKY